MSDQMDWTRRHALEARAAAMVRALTNHPGIHFESGHFWDGDRPLADDAPHLQRQPGLDDAATYRALADSVALRVLLSSNEIHAQQLPGEDPVAALIFEWLEQWRVECIAPARWPGISANLQRRLHRWIFLFEGSGLLETRSGQHLFCFALMAQSRLFAEPVADRLEDLIESAHYRMGPFLAAPLARLRRLRHDQVGYASVARDLSRVVAQWFNDLVAAEDAPPPLRHLNFSISLLPPRAAEGTQGRADVSGVAYQTPDRSGYSVWTRLYDRIVDADSLVRPALLLEYRQRLDAHVARQSWSLARLVQALHRALFRPEPQGRLLGQDEGLIDGRRLAQLVSSPHNQHIFFRERLEPSVRARITLLLDCSGSMRHHGFHLALLMDLLSRAFERAGVPYELLGFTTGAWNGGRPAREWASRGQTPPQPGRLNELQHLIFHAQGQSRQKGRLGLTAVMKPELFREGIDGEAVLWACGRLLEQSGSAAERKILWVVSDGGPMDGATSLANPPGILDAHLRRVVHHQMRENGVEILGVGVGQDLSAYYPHSCALNLDDGVGMHALLDLIHTLERPATV
ncbi:MAG TPA: cobalt chelatase [Castellaniella sp.]|uniref:cobaltochelatase CobT-related protein n=1 Tax=Castellaniella sp. TaxID=1955812 RepID=UPI002F0EBFE0